MSSHSTTDLQNARKTVSFDPNALNKLLNAGSRDGEMRKRVVEVLESERVFDKGKR
jgi:hypothetical protein